MHLNFSRRKTKRRSLNQNLKI